MKKSSCCLLRRLPCSAVFCHLTATGASGSEKKEFTFNKDVASLLYKNCAEATGLTISPDVATHYREARPWARSIKEKVVNRQMPPWSPDPLTVSSVRSRLASKDHRHDSRVGDQCAKKAVRGPPKMPEFVSGGWEIGKPDFVLQMAEDHVSQPDDPDQYINFFIPTTSKRTWVRLLRFIPQQTRRTSRDRVHPDSSDDGEANRKTPKRRVRSSASAVLAAGDCFTLTATLDE